jgi:hypothetical protein
VVVIGLDPLGIPVKNAALHSRSWSYVYLDLWARGLSRERNSLLEGCDIMYSREAIVLLARKGTGE